MLFIFSAFTNPQCAQAAPIVINTVADLQDIQTNLNGDYVLGSNIDASATATWNGGQGFQPIGSNPFQGGSAFTGTFDGLGHTINGLSISRPSTDDIGLFGYLIGYTGGGVVRNLNLTNVAIVGHGTVGGLVGYSDTGHVSSTFVAGSVTGTSAVGGLVGNGGSYYGNSLVTTSHVACNIAGSTNIGGLSGSGAIDIANSYATGTVTGVTNVGGLAGADGGGSISSSYSTGAVSGSSNVGGLIGASGATVTDSYWDTQTSGQSTSVGGIGLTTAQLQFGTLPTGFDPT